MVKINKKVVERLMFDKRMKQVQLIQRSGISKPTIIRLMNGEPFDSVTLGKLANALECSPVDLIDPEGYPDPHLATQGQQNANRQHDTRIIDVSHIDPFKKKN